MKAVFVRTLLLCFLLFRAAGAATLMYTEHGMLNGSLASRSFVNALVTITLTGSTSDIASTAPGVYMVDGTSVFSIAGIGSGTFRGRVGVLEDQSKGTAGFSNFTDGSAVLGTISRPFRSYDLSSAIPEVTGLPAASGSIDTSAGVLFLSYQFGLSSFSATPVDLPVPAAEIPEPGYALCLALAIGVLRALGLKSGAHCQA